MEQGKVAILLALYNPNKAWLVELLNSLNEQSYDNLILLAWNDNPKDTYDYQTLFAKYIRNFEFRIYQGNVNLGSNGAFEELTKLVDTEFIAYCDQDDIWLPDKITTLVKVSGENNSLLVCSDMYVINEYGEVVADSITKVRPRQILYDGQSQFEYLLNHNFVTGCTTLVRSDFAKKCLPFPKEYVHDWWLALQCAAIDKIMIVYKPLIKYRIHSTNQTGTLSGVVDKQSYYKERIEVLLNRGQILKKTFSAGTFIEKINQYCDVSERRAQYFNRFSWRNFYHLFQVRSFNKMTIYFELLIPFLPNLMFKKILSLIQRGKI